MNIFRFAAITAQLSTRVNGATYERSAQRSIIIAKEEFERIIPALKTVFGYRFDWEEYGDTDVELTFYAECGKIVDVHAEFMFVHCCVDCTIPDDIGEYLPNDLPYSNEYETDDEYQFLDREVSI